MFRAESGKISGLLLICLLVILLASPFTGKTQAEAFIDRESAYTNGVIYAELEQYDLALEQFKAIGSYKDAKDWMYYCEGMIALTTAKQLEEEGYLSDAVNQVKTARDQFSGLPQEFQDSAKLCDYCRAWESLLRGFKQSALDSFYALGNFLDSHERYLRIINGPPWPTQAPIVIENPYLPARAAHATRQVDTYFGPGSDYAKQTTVLVNAETMLTACARKDDFVMIELTSDEGKIRAWAQSLRIINDSGEPLIEITGTGRKCTVMSDTVALYGPGEGYQVMNQTLPRGTTVLAFQDEGYYTMIEYTPDRSNPPMYVWVLSDALSR